MEAAVHTWAPELPQEQNENTLYWTDSGVVRSAVDTGPEQARRRGTKTREFFRTPAEFTGAQVAVWKTFLGAIAGGALPFNWTHPVFDVPVVCRLRKEPQWSLYIPAEKDLRRWRGDIEVEILGYIE